MRTRLSTRRAAAAAAGAVGLVLVCAVPASAHVEVSSTDASPGGFGKLVFRVPNESANADTTKVEVRLPADTPFASVSTKPVAGWSVDAEPTKLDKPVDVNGATVTEAVTSVAWTADQGSALAPEQFMEFEISVGPLPEDAQSLEFPTIQTYSDGEVVRWSQPTKEGQAEPEHPAPVLDLTASEGDGHHHDEAGEAAQGSGGDEAMENGGGATDSEAVAPAASTTSTDDSDALARGLAGIGVALGAAALVWAVLSGRRARPKQ